MSALKGGRTIQGRLVKEDGQGIAVLVACWKEWKMSVVSDRLKRGGYSWKNHSSKVRDEVGWYSVNRTGDMVIFGK